MASQLFWRNGVVGDWFTAGNWITSVVPGTGDTAVIESGTAIISSASGASIVGEAIVLGGAEDGSVVILHAINAQFSGSSSVPEVNTTITVSGSLARTTNAIFISEGSTSFDGQIFVEPIGGSLTIQSISDGVNPGTFTLLNTDSKATILVSQESFLDFEGQTFINQGVIELEGGAEISAGVTVTGTGGVFLLENGGHLNVEGSVGDQQQIVFFDGTGKLTIENIADFEGIIGFAELPNAPGQPPLGIAGGRIDLEGIQAHSLTFTAGIDGQGILNLFAGSTPAGQPIAQLSMEMVSSQIEPMTSSSLSAADFQLSSDGHGGTLITYAPQGATFLLTSLPAPVVAAPGDVVSLSSMLVASFGSSSTPFEGVWLFPSEAFENTSTNVGYWTNSDQFVTPAWYIGDEKVTEAKFVTDISNVTLHAGNQIDSPPSFQIRVTDATGGTSAEFITYNIWTVDPAIVQALESKGYSLSSPPTADMIVAAANAYAEVYGNGTIPNTNLCDWIADNVAAGAGATMPFPNADLDPSLNKEGGFWRIAYDSSGAQPQSDWSTLVEPGDIVRMGWFNPENGRISGHSTTVLTTINSEGKIQFYDNNDASHIGIHDSAYWLNTNPTDITIYRIDEEQQFLIQGTDLAEVLHGSVYNNLIRPGGGADVITSGSNNTEIQDTSVNLNGITVTDFNLGDSFDFTDLNPNRTFARYYGGELHVFENFREVAAIEVGKPTTGLSFIVTSDGEGGSSIELGTKQQVVELIIQKVVHWIDAIIDRIIDRIFDPASESDQVAHLAETAHPLVEDFTNTVHDFIDDFQPAPAVLAADLMHDWRQAPDEQASHTTSQFYDHNLWA